jgi:hypothetical protein
MIKRACIALLVVGLSGSAFAQDDEDLVPLSPMPGKAKPGARPKPAKPKPAKPKPAKPKPGPVSNPDDDLVPIAPIAARGDLVVKLSSNVTNAVLLVDGKELGTFPLGPQSVASGEHTITVKRPGYAAFVKKVLVTGGKSIEVEAKLTATAAVLSVTSDRDGAQVLLNGKSIGFAPLNDVEVPAGPAEVAVIKDGYKEESQKINFVVGKDYPVVVKFSPIVSDKPVATNLTPSGTGSGVPLTGVAATAEPVTSKWYFWVGIAAGVAAVAAGTAIGVSAAASQQPPYDQFRVCGAEGCDGWIGPMTAKF